MKWHGMLAKPAPRVQKRLEQLLIILGRYQGRITVRQAFYQMVSANWLPNTHQSYRRVIADLDWLRKAGGVPFEDIEDRNRSIERTTAFEDPEDAREWLASIYDEDRWNTQPRRVAVLVEKAALTGIVQPICDRWRVPYIAVRGYASTSLVAQVAEQLQGYLVLYFGDHDPSGHDMVRDWDTRLGPGGFAAGIAVIHCALTPAQVAQYALPPQPIKRQDSRAAGYHVKHGDDVYELDALPPNVLEQLVEAAITAEIDWAAWNARDAEIEAARGQL